METPEHERRQVVSYLESQSGENFRVEHAEKLTSEHVMGVQYDVWDAHTNEGRWWVITNPTNLYDQSQIKSMDVALSFHIGLSTRVRASQIRTQEQAGSNGALDVARRMDVAGEALDRAREVEDFQAVGMRLREALISFTFGLERLELPGVAAEQSDVKAADFKAKTAAIANRIAGGRKSKELRDLLRQVSEKTWAHVNWLTHARSAGRTDAEIAFAAVNNFFDLFFLAVQRPTDDLQFRCPRCTSYQVVNVHDEGWIKLCRACGWKTETEDPWPVRPDESTGQEAIRPQGECVTLERFADYSTPADFTESQHNQMSDDAAEIRWGNPFAVATGPREIADVHRVLVSDRLPGLPIEGRELVYVCDESACINPEHAAPTALPSGHSWTLAVVEATALHDNFLELVTGNINSRQSSIFIPLSVLENFGFSDASQLLERVVAVDAISQNHLNLLLVARPTTHNASSVVTAYLEFPRDIVRSESKNDLTLF